MPFLGKDWRSGGDYWIRTELGWERTKVLECILDNLNTGLRKDNMRATKKKQQSKRVGNGDGGGCGDIGCKRVNSECDDEEEEAADEEGILADKTKSETAKGESQGKKDDEENEDNDDNDDDEEQEFYDDLLYSSDEEEMLVASEESVERDKHENPVRAKRERMDLKKLCISTSSLSNYKTRQPHIIYLDAGRLDTTSTNRENNAPKASISEVLNALDMPGAVKDIKRFNYVCKLVQLIINEKLNQLSGNAQRTLFMIVKEMLFQVIRTQENLNVMRKLLFDFKKKIQDSYFYYFYYIGSQKLCERHLTTINKWQEMLENPNHKRVKRLLLSTNSTSTTNNNNNNNKKHVTPTTTASIGSGILGCLAAASENQQQQQQQQQQPDEKTGFETIPVDCKLEIMRRINTGLDLVNLAKCNRSLNEIITKELTIWKNLCQFHFQQAHINSLVVNKRAAAATTTTLISGSTGSTSTPAPTADCHCSSSSGLAKNPHEQSFSDLDWKLIYFKLKRRYGHREVYVDMIHKCFYCKSLFWKEIGHPCVIAASMAAADQTTEFEVRSEPITPKRLIDLLLR